MSNFIRMLAQSEAYHSMNGLYSGRAVRAVGPLDLEALSAAVSALGVAHPVLSCRIGRDEEGRPVLVEGSGSDFRLSRCEGRSEDRTAGMPPLDGRVGAVHVVRHDTETWSLTLMTHHSMVDGRHMLKVLADLWSFYAEAAAGRTLRPRSHGIPRPLEELLAERGVEIPEDHPDGELTADTDPEAAQEGAGAAEVPMPQFTASPQAEDADGHPVWRRVVLTSVETQALAAVARGGRTTVNGVVSAALMLSTAEDTGIAAQDLVHVAAVDLRQQVSPPIAPAECTNGIAAAVYCGADPEADLLTLARAITETVRDDLTTGRSLKFIGMTPSLQELFMTSAGRIVGTTNVGSLPRLARPAGVELVDYHRFEQMTTPHGVDNPMFAVSIFEGRLHIDSTLPESVLDGLDRRIRELITVGTGHSAVDGVAGAAAAGAAAAAPLPQEFCEVVLPHLPYNESGTLRSDDELGALGLDSMGGVQLMSVLEKTYNVTLSDDILAEVTFATVGSLWSEVAAALVAAQE
jgi:acyl carrier protein